MYSNDSGIWTVNAIYEYGIDCSDENEETYMEYENFEGIPLTKGWLRDFKFGEHFTSDPQERNASKAHYIGDFKIHQLDEEVDKFGFGGNDYEFIDIRFVHQLQNLYFALTGEELTIKQ